MRQDSRAKIRWRPTAKPEHEKAAPVTHPARSEINRRTLLVAMSGLLSGAAFTRGEGDAPQPAASGAYTPAGFKHALPPEALEQPLATLEQPGALDLDDPEGLRLARMKTMFSLNADYAYSAYMTRHFVMPPDATPYPLVNELELNVSFLTTGGPEFREEYEQGKLMLHGSYTRVFLDAATLQTVDMIDVPTMNRQLTLAPTQFALSIPMDLAPIPHDPTLTEDLRWYRFGEDVHFTNIALFEPSESRPPRMDTSVWRVKHAKLMDPAHQASGGPTTRSPRRRTRPSMPGPAWASTTPPASSPARPASRCTRSTHCPLWCGKGFSKSTPSAFPGNNTRTRGPSHE